MKEKFKIIIKVKDEQICATCKGNAEPASIMAALTQALVSVGNELNYSIDEIIGALQTPKNKKTRKIKKESEKK